MSLKAVDSPALSYLLRTVGADRDDLHAAPVELWPELFPSP